MSLELAVEAMKSGNRGVFFTLEYMEEEVLDRFRAIGVEQAKFDDLFEFDNSDDLCADYIVNRLAAAPRGTSVIIDYLQLLDRSGANPIMTGPNYSPATIREAWEKEAKQRWDDRTHGQGLSLLIVRMAALPSRLMSTSARLLTFEFWRDQNKIRGRFMGLGNSVVVAKLNGDGRPE